VPTLFVLILVLAGCAHFVGSWRGERLQAEGASLAALPSYYGQYLALLWALPGLLALLLWNSIDDAVIRHLLVDSLPPSLQQMSGSELELFLNGVSNVATGMQSSEDPTVQAAAQRLLQLEARAGWAMSAACLLVAAAGAAFAWWRLRPEFRARNAVEAMITRMLMLSASIAVLTTLGILLSVLFESLRFFQQVPVTEFLFGLEWSPQIALRADQEAASGSFGAVPLFAGTALIAAIAMLVAAPIGLLSAIYLSEYAPRRARDRIKPALEVLAGIPTVVYGFFAALTVAPLVRAFGETLGLSVSSESALAAGLVMGIMIIPFVSSLSDDILHAVPQSLRDGSLAMGATHSETIRLVLIPAALPGIVGGLLLAVSRAIGETMIVVMAAGLSARLTANPLESVTTVTVQIVTLLVGDQEFDSPKTLAAFALGLALFLVTLGLNVIALQIVRRYREQYE
jgi:phosphate transport system permease protein